MEKRHRKIITMTNDKEHVDIPDVPPEFPMDQGYSWIILACGFMGMFISLGFGFSMGVYFDDLRDTFEASRGEAALFGSIQFGAMCLAGPLASVGIRRYGAHTLVPIGGIISSIACAIAGFATNMSQLTGLFGIGLSPTLAASVSIQAQYFKKYRYFATGCVTVGSTVGSIIFAPMIRCLIDRFGVTGSMFVNSGVVLQMLPIGLLMQSRTLERHKPISQLLGASSFTTCHFWFIVLQAFFMGAATFIFYSSFAGLVTQSGLFSSDDAVFALSIGAGMNLICRVLVSVVSNIRWFPRVLMCALTNFIYAIAIGFATGCSNFSCFLASSCTFNAGYGLTLPLVPALLLEFYNPSEFTTMFSYTIALAGCGSLTIPVLAGKLADYTEDLNTAFHFGCTCGILSGLCGLVVFALHQNKKHVTCDDNLIVK